MGFKNGIQHVDIFEVGGQHWDIRAGSEIWILGYNITYGNARDPKYGY